MDRQLDPTPKMKRVIVAECEQYGGDWPPEDYPGLVSWFADKCRSVPEEYRGTVRCRISSGMSFDQDYGTIHIHYDRLETTQEVEQRIQARQAWLLRERERLEAQLARLSSVKPPRTAFDVMAACGNFGADTLGGFTLHPVETSETAE